MSIGPIDYYGELSPDYDEVEWPGPLPDIDEEWAEWWWMNTVSLSELPSEWLVAHGYNPGAFAGRDAA